MGSAMSYLIDTNILIYFFNGSLAEESRKRVTEMMKQAFHVSIISKMEFLGFDRFSVEERQKAGMFLSNARVLGLEDAIVDRVIQMKQEKKIKLPDAVIAATAIHHDLTIVTRNSKDFKGLELSVYNPFPE
ncbi:MAG: type II toxin-antitoxin system VapC family toxin [SAR324 cluster bacterium]|nr:type II toxin-antitoxin system VapC family toxin [SAR324 cluster bacterium]